ncbi:hypothetical protein F511_30570 [Dorcoceras hygrometricum]|uniref:Uncharacterized protein n=1 Tax=Dorcoceras hygrometricum TaxID=472368 RepID=A0A2Z7BTZ7_9LAMI|nr:hypothetical protein F511_30570 [Dorcoceras hygrometricum]
MVKRLATSSHDPLGIIDSACKNQLVVVSVQYGHFNTYIPIRSTTIGKSRVARDPITMHTSWRSNSDIACLRLVLCEELLRLDRQLRAMVNAGQRSCACDWLCWYVPTGTRRGKHCALFCLATGYPAAGSMRRRLDKLVRRRFEDQSMVCLPFVPYLVNPRTLFSRELFGDFPSFPVVVLLVRVAHYHTVNTPRGHYTLSMILGAMFEFLSSLVGRAFPCSLASHA